MSSNQQSGSKTDHIKDSSVRAYPTGEWAVVKVCVEDEEDYIETFRAQFAPQPEFRARYLFIIEGRKKPLFLEVNEGELTIHYGQEENIDVYAKLKPEVMDSIVDGRMTFQRAFMTGEMTAKGNFKILRMLDTMFNFV